MGFYTEGILTNPSSDAILADTGPVTFSAAYDLSIMVSSTVNAVVVLEYRDSPNAGNVFSHTFPVSANVPLVFNLPHINPVNTGQRVRLRLRTGITGLCQGSLAIG